MAKSSHNPYKPYVIITVILYILAVVLPIFATHYIANAVPCSPVYYLSRQIGCGPPLIRTAVVLAVAPIAIGTVVLLFGVTRKK